MKTFKAGIYLRLSDEDRKDYGESLSISNQRECIMKWMDEHPDIHFARRTSMTVLREQISTVRHSKI